MLLGPQYHARIAAELENNQRGAGIKYLDYLVIDDAIPYAALYAKKPEMVISYIRKFQYPKKLMEYAVQILVNRNLLPPMLETKELRDSAMRLFESNASWALSAVYFISETIPLLPDEYKS